MITLLCVAAGSLFGAAVWQGVAIRDLRREMKRFKTRYPTPYGNAISDLNGRVNTLGIQVGKLVPIVRFEEALKAIEVRDAETARRLLALEGPPAAFTLEKFPPLGGHDELPPSTPASIGTR